MSNHANHGPVGLDLTVIPIEAFDVSAIASAPSWLHDTVPLDTGGAKDTTRPGRD